MYLIHLVIILVVGIHGVVKAQSSDESGNFPASDLQSLAPLHFSHQYIGEVLNSFPNPSALRGLTFREGKLWGVTAAGAGGTGVLFEMNADSGAVLSMITISPLSSSSFTFGLGFDTLRNVFVVTDPADDLILKVNPTTGEVTGTFSSPGSGPVGAAYDSTRDGYWISDFETNKVHLVNPDTGAEITSLPVPSGASSIAGTGYDSVNDVIMFHSRDSGETYLMTASDGVQVGVFPTPPSLGENNGQGAAVRPTDLTGYLTNFNDPTIFVVDLELAIPEPSTILEHFLSYGVRRTKGTPKFEKQEVNLTDQFESGVLFEVKKPKELYNPTDKNGEGIIDPDTHLVGYEIKRAKTDPPQPKHVKRTNIKVVNQFGTIFVDTKKPDRLLVPSLEDLDIPIPDNDVPDEFPVDHFKCYKVKVTEGTPEFPEGIQVTVGDQFTDPPEVFDVEGPKRLCNPVDKNGEGIINPIAHLMCYKVKPAEDEPKHIKVEGIHTNNQFGPLQVDTKKEAELCVPSTKQIDP